MNLFQIRFAALLGRNLDLGERQSIPELDVALATRLLARLDSMRLFAHAYTHLMNFTHGSFREVDTVRTSFRSGAGRIEAVPAVSSSQTKQGSI